MKTDNVETKDPFDIGNILNDFFLSPPTPSKMSSYDPLVNTISNQQNLFSTPTTPGEVLDEIKILCNNSFKNSTIPTKVLKLISTDLSILLSKLVDLCFQKGQFPNCLKIAQINPTHKKTPNSIIETTDPLVS